MKNKSHSWSKRKKIGVSAGVVLGVVAIAAAVTVAVVDHKVDAYQDPGQHTVSDAQYTEKRAKVNDVDLSYVEGPDNGPPLVLLHAQHMDWYSYHAVMPDLAKNYHVFNVDYPGHGSTVVPADYPMTADRIGTDLAKFMQDVVKEPAFVTGNSSGGLLATWLAANRPDLVRAVLLEDPPLFSSEAGRIDKTIADRSFKTSADAVREGTDDFLLYWIDHNKEFFRNRIAPGADVVLREAVISYRKANPGQPVEISLLPNDLVRQFVRGMNSYDPRFGAAFHDGAWNQGFDHAAALQKINCPVLLLQANTATLPDGTLNGAMSPEDAQRATSLLKHGTYEKIDAEHVVHLDKPDEFVRILEDFFR